MSTQSVVKRVTLSLALASLFAGAQCYADEPLPGAQEGMLVGGGVPGKVQKAAPTIAGEASPSDQPGAQEGILVGGNSPREVTVTQGFTGGQSARSDLPYANSDSVTPGAREGMLVGGNARWPNNGMEGNQRTAAVK
jgi:hypothetical protein